MADSPAPVLVYTRIAANVRKTRLLVALFAAALLPVVTAATVVAMPFAAMLVGMVATDTIGTDEIARRLDAMSAELDAVAPSGGRLRLRDLPSSVVWLTGGLLGLAFVGVALAFAVATLVLVWRYGSRMLLFAAHARPVDPDQEPELVRLVENLCIGAGLPTPRLHVVESPSPNAFATGRNPEDASLVVTRGLLMLLDRRELQGVIAHELAHIGNLDTRLTTLLAAFVGTTALPWRIGLAPVRFSFRVHPWAGILAGCFAGLIGLQFLGAFWFGLDLLVTEAASSELPAFMWWWMAHALFAVAYALFVAPLAALIIRQAVSRQREFLADADAVKLTRDPEGLALALAKVGAAGGQRLRVGEGSVHLYIVDPRGGHSPLHWVFPSHPTLQDRIDLLARMGSGISDTSLQAAIEAGRRIRRQPEIGVEPSRTPLSGETFAGAEPESAAPSVLVNEGPGRPSQARIPLYEAPDGWSRVLAQLDEETVLTLLGKEGHFVRVVTADNVRGYVSASAPLSALGRVVDRRDP